MHKHNQSNKYNQIKTTKLPITQSKFRNKTKDKCNIFSKQTYAHKFTSKQYNTPNVNKINGYPITTLLTKSTQPAQNSNNNHTTKIQTQT